MNQILIGKGEHPVHLLAKYGNRHGLVAGATGTGKTISLMVLAEGFSRMGVPVFMADVKGDVAGLALAGITNEKIQQRVAQIGMEGYANEASPVLFWDLYGKAGHPVRTTISEIGPSLLGRILEINETQEGMLEIAFKLADDQGLLLLDLDDLRALLGFRLGQSQGDLDPIWSGQHPVRGGRSARPVVAGAGGRKSPVRRARTGTDRFAADRPQRPRHREHPCR